MYLFVLHVELTYSDGVTQRWSMGKNSSSLSIEKFELFIWTIFQVKQVVCWTLEGGIVKVADPWLMFSGVPDLRICIDQDIKEIVISDSLNRHQEDIITPTIFLYWVSRLRHLVPGYCNLNSLWKMNVFFFVIGKTVLNCKPCKS